MGFRVKGRREEVVPISNCLLEFLRGDLGAIEKKRRNTIVIMGMVHHSGHL